MGTFSTRAEYCELALERMSRPDMASVSAVLGGVLRERCQNVFPACILLDQLSQNQALYLGMWESDCSAYLSYLRDPASGSVKAQNDLIGRARSCSRDEFDKYLLDFDAEMAAVRELGKIGFEQFEPIPTLQNAKTVDYTARYNSNDVAVEIKNLRAPRTILDVFGTELRARYREEPSRFPFRLLLTYYSDNTVTELQRREIADYTRNLAGKQPPLLDSLELNGGVALTVRVENGTGDVAMTRGEGFERRGETSLQGFLNKVDFHTRSAISQFATEPNRAHVLVFNINSPAGSIPSDFLNAAAERVADLSNGDVRCEFLLHRYRIAPDNV
jgi:hypothetical protein